MNESFFADLPIMENFSDIAKTESYADLPPDWYVAVTDVRDSTRAIQEGRYKEVNLLGASTIIGILNLRKSFSLPFLFSGDGAVVCIPDSLVEQARQSLSATRRMAREIFDLELRAGIVSHSFIRSQGYSVLVARYRVSEHFSQAVFAGGGLQFAEECIKDPMLGLRFGVGVAEKSALADYSGLECRWKNVPSAHGEIVSIIVQALGETIEQRNTTYRVVLEQIQAIYGTDVMCHPIREDLLSLSLSEKQLSGESRIRSFGKGFWYRIWYWLKIRYAVLAGLFLMHRNITTAEVEWGRYKSDLVANTDFKKFDDKLRLVLSGTTQQRLQLVAFLDKCFHRRELVFGIHAAPAALITCLIFNYQGAHIHLVDSDNGGYTLAAAQLKRQLKELRIE